MDVCLKIGTRISHIAILMGKIWKTPLELLEYPIFRQPLMQSPSQKTSEQTQPVHFASQ